MGKLAEDWRLWIMPRTTPHPLQSLQLPFSGDTALPSGPGFLFVFAIGPEGAKRNIYHNSVSRNCRIWVLRLMYHQISETDWNRQFGRMRSLRPSLWWSSAHSSQQVGMHSDSGQTLLYHSAWPIGKKTIYLLVLWEHSLCLWPFSIAMLNHQRVNLNDVQVYWPLWIYSR